MANKLSQGKQKHCNQFKTTKSRESTLLEKLHYYVNPTSLQQV